MKRIARSAGVRLGVLALGLGLAAGPAAMLAQGPPPGWVYRQGPWEQPPNEFTRDLQRDAFRQGFEGARRDLENRRRPDVRNRDEFRNYRGPARGVWRDAFRRGYNTFWAHVDGYRR